jgi:hypothetical protein
MILAYIKRVSRTLAGPTALLATLTVSGPVAASGAGLAERMSHLQRHTHKLQLSVEARHPDLVGFYLHEIEEVAEEIRDEVETYDDHPIGRLTGEMLLPAVEALEEPTEAGDWEAADAAFDRLLAACNACHATTAHGYIRIVRTPGNPYNQDFSPTP